MSNTSRYISVASGDAIKKMDLDDLIYEIDLYSSGISPFTALEIMRELAARIKRLKEVNEAANNLCKVKGRFNSEQAMLRLMKACGFEVFNK